MSKLAFVFLLTLALTGIAPNVAHAFGKSKWGGKFGRLGSSKTPTTPKPKAPATPPDLATPPSYASDPDYCNKLKQDINAAIDAWIATQDASDALTEELNGYKKPYGGWSVATVQTNYRETRSKSYYLGDSPKWCITEPLPLSPSRSFEELVDRYVFYQSRLVCLAAFAPISDAFAASLVQPQQTLIGEAAYTNHCSL